MRTCKEVHFYVQLSESYGEYTIILYVRDENVSEILAPVKITDFEEFTKYYKLK